MPLDAGLKGRPYPIYTNSEKAIVTCFVPKGGAVRHPPRAGGFVSGAASKAVAQVARWSPGGIVIVGHENRSPNSVPRPPAHVAPGLGGLGGLRLNVLMSGRPLISNGRNGPGQRSKLFESHWSNQWLASVTVNPLGSSVSPRAYSPKSITAAWGAASRVRHVGQLTTSVF